jgi:golgi phosphoprotein 3
MMTLFEELFLLSIDDEDGSPHASMSDNLGFGMSGSLVVELALRGKAGVGENHRLEVMDTTHTGDEILDETLEQIQSSNQPRKVTYWIKHFSDEPKKLRNSLVKRLEANGVVQQDENRLTWVIPFRESPTIKASAKYTLKDRIRKGVLADEDLDMHDLALLGLVKACNLLNLVFTKDERKLARQRIYELTVSNTLKDPLFQSIQEIEAAVESQAEA